MNAVTQRAGGFALQPTTMQEAMDMATMLSNSQMVPKDYKGKPEDTLIAMMMGTELGLNPIQSLQNIAVINGRPSIYGDALMALVQNHRSFGGVEETFDEVTMTATCTVWRKGGTKHHQTFSKEDAAKANLWGKTGPWTQYPKRMLQMRARGFALRNQFSDALAGLITREEAMDMPEAERDITDQSSVEREHQPAPSLPNYPEEKFNENFPKWEQMVAENRAAPDQIVAMISSKATLSESQKEQILNIKQGEKQCA